MRFRADQHRQIAQRLAAKAATSPDPAERAKLEAGAQTFEMLAQVASKKRSVFSPDRSDTNSPEKTLTALPEP